MTAVSAPRSVWREREKGANNQHWEHRVRNLELGERKNTEENENCCKIKV